MHVRHEGLVKPVQYELDDSMNSYEPVHEILVLLVRT